MLVLEIAEKHDIENWNQFDGYIAEDELRRKIENKRCYLLKVDDKLIGVLRYNLFWDSIPFVTLIYLDETVRGMGYGRMAMQQWEAVMRMLGYTTVMTSTQSDEGAQHFYRKLGYQDTGCLILNVEPYRQPAELFFIKSL